MIEIFYPNKKTGKIEFTKKELEEVLNRVYNQGYDDGKASSWTWTSPWHYNDWFYSNISNSTAKQPCLNTATTTWAVSDDTNYATNETKLKEKTLNDFSEFFKDLTDCCKKD